jgi:hypothetical protein
MPSSFGEANHDRGFDDRNGNDNDWTKFTHYVSERRLYPCLASNICFIE